MKITNPKYLTKIETTLNELNRPQKNTKMIRKFNACEAVFRSMLTDFKTVPSLKERASKCEDLLDKIGHEIAAASHVGTCVIL